MKQMILKMALPALIRILADAIKSAELPELRDDVLNWLLFQARKTNTPFDDKMLEVLVPVLFTPEIVADFINTVVPLLKVYVKSSVTPWDDYIFIPILEAVEETFAIEHRPV